MSGFAEQLNTLRIDRGWTIEELAARAYCSGGCISLLENGKSRPSFDVFRHLAYALGVDFNTLGGWDNEKSPPVCTPTSQ